jgi:hypothetical protein
MAVLDLQPTDRAALIDLVHAELLSARERTEASAAAERQLLRISATLIGSELDVADPDANAEAVS